LIPGQTQHLAQPLPTGTDVAAGRDGADRHPLGVKRYAMPTRHCRPTFPRDLFGFAMPAGVIPPGDGDVTDAA
jgi:hypothetical protein